MTRPRRATRMAPVERRDALIEVYLRLAIRHGRRPSTGEIATEAGVAEGTIYRAFPTKEALESEAVQAAFCPAPVQRLIEQIGAELTMRDRLVSYTRIMQDRFSDVFGLMQALGLTQPPVRTGHDACFAAGRHQHGAGGADEDEPSHQPLLDAITEMVTASSDELAIPPDDVIHRLRLLTFSASHPGIADGRLLTPEQIVDTILDGVRRRGAHPREAAPDANRKVP